MTTTETTTTAETVKQIFTPQEITNGTETESINAVRNAFIDFAGFLQTKLVEGRYKSIVYTKLEEAAMFATKTFTHTKFTTGY